MAEYADPGGPEFLCPGLPVTALISETTWLVSERCRLVLRIKLGATYF
jgi:hypothetical protein